MKNNKPYLFDAQKSNRAHKPVFVPRNEERNPELIEKFYRQIVNSFGYAYPAKV